MAATRWPAVRKRTAFAETEHAEREHAPAGEEEPF